MSIIGGAGVVLGAANGVSFGSVLRGGSLNAFIASQVPGIGKLGMKYAATGGFLVKGVLIWKNPDGSTYSTFAFPMNPESISDSVSPEWAEFRSPGQNRPLYQFAHGGAREVSFTLHFFFEDRDRRKIRDQIQVLQSLARRPLTGNSTHTATGSPPAVNFFFGEFFKGERFIVSKVDAQAHTLFDPALLLPLRAEVNIVLLEAPDPTQPPSQVRMGDRIGSATSIIRAAF